jgi:hypothetical protein
MAKDPQRRPGAEGVQPVQPENISGLVPEEPTEPDQKRNTADSDWLSMATADPALFLKDAGPE